MNGTLMRALVSLVPVSALLCRSLILFHRSRTTGVSLQLIGTAGLITVVLAHICEGLNVFPWMHWGLEHSAGHYLDLISAFLGITFFLVGFFLNLFSRRSA